MNKLVIIFLILSIGCSNQNVPLEEELKLTLEEFNQAYKAGDVEKLSSMIAENYVHTNSSWKSFDKETWLGYMNNRSTKINEGALIVESYEMDELSIEMHKDVAITTARISTVGVDNGEQFDKKFRVSNVWIYDGSRWLRAGFHDTLIE
ncbi:nuclear transport factor 2 family protein [Ekhidna sp.]|uniref:nuclear transport factor 2 family protein n=1 Tax=Ekhidna sp. TaxID=2608089 RepID=UPI003CCBBD0D